MMMMKREREREREAMREAENIGEPLCRQKINSPRRGMKNEQSALRNEVERRKRDNK